MFLKKSLLFMTALALLMFAGQASAQLTLAVGGGGSTTVSGQGTTITVEVAQTGITQSVSAIEVEFDIDSSVLTLTGGSATGFLPLGFANNTAAFGAVSPTAVPASASFTFTTAMDVTGKEFSIGIKAIRLNNIDLAGIPLPAAIAFNAGGGGMPPPPALSVSLTSDTVSGIVASQDIKVKVAVDGVTQTAGAEIVFAVTPAAATITDVEPAAGLGVLERDGMRIVLGGLPTMLSGGHYATVTFTTNGDVTAETEFSIGVASFEVFTATGMRESADTTMSLKVNETPPVTLGEFTTQILTYLSPAGGTGQLTLEPDVSGASADRAVFSFSLPGSPAGVTISSVGSVATVTSRTAADVDVMVEAEVDGFVTSSTISVAFPLRERWLELRDVESELDGLLRGDLDKLTQTPTSSASGGSDDYHKNVRLEGRASVEIVAHGFSPSANVKLDHTVKVGNIGRIVEGCHGGDHNCWTVSAESSALDDVVNAVVSLTASVPGSDETTDSVDLAFKTRPELHWHTPAATAQSPKVWNAKKNRSEAKNIWRPYEESWKIVVPVHGTPPPKEWWNERGSQTIIIKPMGFNSGSKISIDFDQQAGTSSVDAYWDEVKREYRLTAMGRDFADVEVRANDDDGNMTSPQPVGFMLHPLTLELDPAPVKDNVTSTELIVRRPNYVEDMVPTNVTMTLPRQGTSEVTVMAKGFFTFNEDIDFTVRATKDGESRSEVVTDGKGTPGFKRSIKDSVLTLSVSEPGVVVVTASEGSYSAVPLTITFLSPKPWLEADGEQPRDVHVSAVIDTIPHRDPGAGDVVEGGGMDGKVEVVARGFAEGAVIDFPFEVDVESTGTIMHRVVRDSVLILEATGPATVRVRATDRVSANQDIDTTEWTRITFVASRPELRAMDMLPDWKHDRDWRAVIPAGGTFSTEITTVGFPANAQITFVTDPSGADIVSYEWNRSNNSLTLTAQSGEDSAKVVLHAKSGGVSTPQKEITFLQMPHVLADPGVVEIPSPVTTPHTRSITVEAVNFPTGAKVEFKLNVTEGDSSLIKMSQKGHVLTLTSSYAATVEVTATDGTTTTDPITITFNEEQLPAPAAPSNLVVQDIGDDNGYLLMLSFTNSEDHASVSQYRIYREMMVNDAAGNPVAEWVPWAVIDALPSENGVTRAVVPVPDGIATRWGVAAESGMDSSDSSDITPSGKRVFSKESVQLLAEVLGVDPNRIVSEDELAQMFMPSAEYIQSIIGDQKNVVFAALDPDVSVLMGGDVAIPQNIRTGSGPIVSSAIVMTEDAVAAVDNIPPAAVTDVAADAETGMVTWTVSADDMVVGAVEYRGFSIPIPGVIGYKIMGGASEDAMIDIGAVSAGTGSFQVPAAVIESLINQGVPAVLVTVVALDGTNMTPSMPLVVELAPTRKRFVDANGDPVFIVALDDGDLVVDFADFIAFTRAFNTDESHENWRVFIQADLNDDGVVNFDDFILFFDSYGKEATGPAGKSLIPPPGVNETAELSLRLGSDRVVAGENMFVDVSLANVQALMGYGFVLHYDAEKFEFVEAMPAAEDLLLSSGGETPLLRGWSPEAGQVHVMNAIVNGSEVSGGGDLVRLVFRVLRDFEDDARFEIAEGLVFDPSQLANPLAGGVLDIQTTPTEFALLQNFPNPFNPETTIGYELAESGDVTLQIYNVVGQVVRTLIAAEPQSVGRYQVRWDGMDDRGMPVSSGIYFYQISAGKFQDVRKLMLLK